MDKMKKYRQILESVTKQHEKIESANENVRSIAVCDFEQNDFFLIDMDENKEHYVVFHLHLEDEKVWIEQDGIEYGIATDLIDAGIPAENIFGKEIKKNPKMNKELLAA